MILRKYTTWSSILFIVILWKFKTYHDIFPKKMVSRHANTRQFWITLSWYQVKYHDISRYSMASRRTSFLKTAFWVYPILLENGVLFWAVARRALSFVLRMLVIHSITSIIQVILLVQLYYLPVRWLKISGANPAVYIL